MFASTLNPPLGGRWTRLAPIGAALLVAVGFVLALTVFLAALRTGHTLATLVPDPPAGTATATAPGIVVQRALPLVTGG